WAQVRGRGLISSLLIAARLGRCRANGRDAGERTPPEGPAKGSGREGAGHRAGLLHRQGAAHDIVGRNVDADLHHDPLEREGRAPGRGRQVAGSDGRGRGAIRQADQERDRLAQILKGEQLLMRGVGRDQRERDAPGRRAAGTGDELRVFGVETQDLIHGAGTARLGDAGRARHLHGLGGGGFGQDEDLRALGANEVNHRYFLSGWAEKNPPEGGWSGVLREKKKPALGGLRSESFASGQAGLLKSNGYLCAPLSSTIGTNR